MAEYQDTEESANPTPSSLGRFPVFCRYSSHPYPPVTVAAARVLFGAASSLVAAVPPAEACKLGRYPFAVRTVAGFEMISECDSALVVNAVAVVVTVFAEAAMGAGEAMPAETPGNADFPA